MKVVCAFMFVVMSVPAFAHHGAASFDTSKEVTHCFLKFDAKDDTGTVRNWAVEVSNPTDMTKRGWSRSSFKIGDPVTVSLQAVKTGAPIGRLTKVILADGSALPGGAELGTPDPAPAQR